MKVKNFFALETDKTGKIGILKHFEIFGYFIFIGRRLQACKNGIEKITFPPTKEK